MRNFSLVFKYSLNQSLKAKSFYIVILVSLILISSIVWLPKISEQFTEHSVSQIVILDNTGLLENNIDHLIKSVSSDYNWSITDQQGIDEATNQLINNENNVAAVIEINPVKFAAPSIEIKINKSEDIYFANLFSNYIQNQFSLSTLKSSKLDDANKQLLTAEVKLQISNINTEQKSIEEMFAPLYILSFLLYILIVMYGGSIAQSVAAEKSSRVKEILITKVKPIHLLFGKVLGVGLAGLLQFTIILIMSFLIIKLANRDIKLFGMNLDLSVLSVKTLIFLLLFFILGYFFYAVLYAAAGSLVSRSEEINQVSLPLTLLIMLAMLVALTTMISPESQFVVVSSYIPFFTPFVMFVRIGMTDLSAIEIIVPTLILIISILAASIISAKIYKVGVLLYGINPGIRKLLKAIKSM